MRATPFFKFNKYSIIFCLSQWTIKNYFQYTGVPLTELINQNALPLATNLSIIPSQSFLTNIAMSVPDLILCTAKFIDEHKNLGAQTSIPISLTA